MVQEKEGTTHQGSEVSIIDLNNVVQESGEREGTTHQGSEVSIIDLNNVVQEKENELHTKVQK